MSDILPECDVCHVEYIEGYEGPCQEPVRIKPDGFTAVVCRGNVSYRATAERLANELAAAATTVRAEPAATTPPTAGSVVAYGPYSLVATLLTGGLLITRRDSDDRTRTVANVDSLADWDRFAAALAAGADEVTAVHALDQDAPR